MLLRNHMHFIDFELTAQANSLHVEYDFGPLGKGDFLDISTENDSFYCRPSKPNVITKLAFATEELYLRSQKASPAEPAIPSNAK